MAWVKDCGVAQVKSGSLEFDTLHDPNSEAPFPGIYRCQECGLEIASVGSALLPSSSLDHHHNTEHGPIKWRLIVRAAHSAWIIESKK